MPKLKIVVLHVCTTSNTSDTVFHHLSNTKKRVENMMHSRVFLSFLIL